jgi:hypothetical protein
MSQVVRSGMRPPAKNAVGLATGDAGAVNGPAAG